MHLEKVKRNTGRTIRKAIARPSDPKRHRVIQHRRRWVAAILPLDSQRPPRCRGHESVQGQHGVFAKAIVVAFYSEIVDSNPSSRGGIPQGNSRHVAQGLPECTQLSSKNSNITGYRGYMILSCMRDVNADSIENTSAQAQWTRLRASRVNPIPWSNQ